MEFKQLRIIKRLNILCTDNGFTGKDEVTTLLKESENKLWKILNEDNDPVHLLNLILLAKELKYGEQK